MPKKRGRPLAVAKEALLAAIRKCRGLIHLAALRLKISPRTVFRYLEKWPDAKAAVAEQREQRLDIAELGLMGAVDRGEAWAICFYLKTQGKQRGYIERQERTVDSNVRLMLTEEIVAGHIRASADPQDNSATLSSNGVPT